MALKTGQNRKRTMGNKSKFINLIGVYENHTAAQTVADLAQRVGVGELAEQHRHQLGPATEALGAPLGVVFLDQRPKLDPGEMLEQLIEQTGCLYDWIALLFRDSVQHQPAANEQICSRSIIGGLFLRTASPGTQLKSCFGQE
jgi:hypothetical protein